MLCIKAGRTETPLCKKWWTRQGISVHVEQEISSIKSPRTRCLLSAMVDGGRPCIKGKGPLCCQCVGHSHCHPLQAVDMALCG